MIGTPVKGDLCVERPLAQPEASLSGLAVLPRWRKVVAMVAFERRS
jgi:hypothetical protein